MKINTKIIALAFTVSTSGLCAQNVRPCSTSEIDNENIKNHPEILIERQKLEEFTQKFIEQQAKQKSAQVIYTIPLVFHIIHNYGTENISDAQIYDEIKVLNRDYSKTNSDTNQVIAEFKSKIGNPGFQFALAQIDPSGNCTNGIDRVASIKTYNGDNSAKFNDWPNNKYVNVWVVKNIYNGSAGFAYYPGGTSAATDGIMMLADYVGSIGTSSVSHSRCLTHELGHHFNLSHVWGSNNTPGTACGNDGVTDTPNTKGWNFCPAGASAAQICTPGVVENYQNYMEYSYCCFMFTPGQVSRMQAAANSSTSGRNNLWSAANLTATGVSAAPNLCKADFYSDKPVVCENGQVKFTDNSWNGTPTSWSWTFPGGSPATSNVASPTVTYSTEGVYNVSLTVSNGTSSPSITKTSFVTVVANQAAYPLLPYAEGFESVSAFPNADWTINNIDNKAAKWQVSKTVKYSGTSSAMMNNFTNDTAQVDELTGPTVDLTSIGNPKLFYRVAYAQKDASSNDVLKVRVSTNCGVSWGTRQTKSGTNLKSVAPQTTVFTPTTTSQWRLDSVSLAPYSAYKNVRVQFQFINAEGNNLYLDDINITGTSLTTGIGSLLSDNLNFTIYPNPSQDRSVVAFNLAEKAKVSVKLYDILGKEVLTLVDGQQLPGGEYKYPFSDNGMNTGVYFVKLMVDDKLFVQKMIMQ